MSSLPREQGQRVADQSDQRECPHAAKVKAALRFNGAALLPFESDQKREEQDDDDLDALGRQQSGELGQQDQTSAAASRSFRLTNVRPFPS